jgi:hypothetical protein
LSIDSDSGLAKLTAASLDADNLPIQNDSSTSFTVKDGISVLFLTVITPDNTDNIRVLESCPGGGTQVIDQFPFDASNPSRGYRIVGL